MFTLVQIPTINGADKRKQTRFIEMASNRQIAIMSFFLIPEDIKTDSVFFLKLEKIKLERSNMSSKTKIAETIRKTQCQIENFSLSTLFAKGDTGDRICTLYLW